MILVFLCHHRQTQQNHQRKKYLLHAIRVKFKFYVESPISTAKIAAYLLLTSYNSFFSPTKVIYNKEKASVKAKKLQYFCKKRKFFLKKFGGIKKTLYFCTRNQTKD